MHFGDIGFDQQESSRFFYIIVQPNEDVHFCAFKNAHL